MKIIRLLISFLIFITLFIEYFHPIAAINQDLGRHLKTGEIILTTYSVPKINLFSYTFPNFTFINTHWLSEVIFFIVYNLVGFSGLLVFTTILVLSAFLSVYIYSYKNTDIFALSITSFLSLLIIADRIDLRPEIFSFLFLAIFVSILYKNREHFTKFIYLLPFLEILWVNIHIYFAIGEVITGLFLLDFFIKNKLKINGKIIPLVIVFIGTFLAAFINPNSYIAAFYPLTVFSNYGYTIQENQNIFLSISSQGYDIAVTAFIITVLLFFILLVINKKYAKPIDWFIAVAFTIIGSLAVRDLALFAFAAFIPFSKHLSLVTQKFYSQYKEKTGKLKDSKISIAITRKKTNFLFYILIMSIFLALVGQSYSFIAQNGFGWNLPANDSPAVNFFLKYDLQGPIFNNFDIGSYLDFRLYPQEKVFVDGRPEAYPASFFQNVYIPMQLYPSDFSIVDSIYHFNTIFFTISDQTPWAQRFEGSILNDPNWSLVYLDSTCIILVKNIPQNQELINRFGITAQNFKLLNLKSDTITQLAYLANLFASAHWVKQKTQVDHQLLRRKNEIYRCPALADLISIYYARNNNKLLNIYEQRYLTECAAH